MVLGNCRTVTLQYLGAFRNIVFIIIIIIIFFFLFFFLKQSLFSTSLVPRREEITLADILALGPVPGIQVQAMYQ